jgi:DNA primase
MALEEGLSVKLVLIPDKEDPDSYVNKVGAAAFQDFVAKNKKDFILFQLEVMLKDAGTDVTKKSEVVNQVADTLSKINKTEDFTKLQDYIKQCSSLLKIDEGGLTNLVNKYKRDKIAKEEKKLPFEEADFYLQQTTQTRDIANDNYLLINQDEAHEKNVLRVLLEYGLRSWDEEKSMAQYIFEELEQFHFDNPQLENVFNEYKSWYDQGLHPDAKSFLYHADDAVRNLVTGITVFPHELSQKWDERLEGMNIANRDTSHQDVLVSVSIFKLRKIKKMFEENQRDMENAPLDEQLKLIEVHKNLKQIEKELSQQLGTVIMK